MRGSRWTLVFVAVLSIMLFGLPASAAAGDVQSAEEFAKLLVAKSPWEGEWKGTYRSGTLEAVFAIKDGKLSGEFTKADRVGPLADVTAEMKNKPTLSFRHIMGISYVLELDKEGNLVGDYVRDRFKGLVILRPRSN